MVLVIVEMYLQFSRFGNIFSISVLDNLGRENDENNYHF